MKFKIGDKVKIVSCKHYSKQCIGRIGEVTSVWTDGDFSPFGNIVVKGVTDTPVLFHEYELCHLKENTVLNLLKQIDSMESTNG